jgi:hypothetical protein
VVFCAPGLADAPDFTTWLDDRLAGRSVEVEIEPLPAEPAVLHRRIAALECRLVALEADAAQPDRLRDLVAKLGCDVLVVR